MPKRSAPDLGRAISQWEGSLRAARKAERTIHGYVRACEYLVEAHGSDADPATMTIEDIELVVGRWRGVSATTVHIRLVAIREFFRWGEARYKWDNPTRLLTLPRKDQPELRRLSIDEVQAIAAAALRMPKRDRVIISVFCYLGLRRAEILALVWGDVDLEAGTLRVTGKGRKDRLLPIPAGLAQVLLLNRDGAEDLAFVAHHITNKTEVWLESGGVYRADMTRPCSPQTIDRVVKRCAKLAGVRNPRTVTSHMFRRSLLGRLLDSGHSPYIVAAIAGHADIKTTAGYGGGASLRAVRETLLRDTTLEIAAKALTEKEGFEPSTEVNPL
jgi:site-specific recombinase XerD